MRKILYIDDNQDNLEIFCEQFNGTFDIVTLSNPLEVFKLLGTQRFDAILLDIHMPERNGFQVLEDINQSPFSKIPVLFFTTDELQVLRYQALKTSALDVIYRTQSPEEIELRILNKINLFDKMNGDDNSLKIDSLILKLDTLEAFCGDNKLNLTPIEFKILVSLVRSYPEKITREDMISKAWNLDSVQDRTVNTHVTNLRNKLPNSEFTIETLRGSGLILKKIATTELNGSKKQ